MQLYTLSSGLRVLCIHNDRPTVYCGIMMGTGTRHELEHESGMAHLVEHMSFKGTQRRSAMQIINRMESVGGELNAFTTKQETVYYSICLRQHLGRAIDLLKDIVFHSTYPQEALEREVEVVIDEIDSYKDSPSELIYDDFESLLFGNHPLGRSILGDADRLRSYHSSDLQSFTRRLYTHDRAVLFIMGDVQPKVRGGELKIDNISLGNLGRSLSPPLPKGMSDERGDCVVGSHILHKSTHQAHILMGTTTVPLGDERFMGLFLLNNLLGGPGMNSRFNLTLRERRGLVYTVESSLVGYADTGVWNVYMGCDQADINKCLHLVRTELNRLLDKPLTERVLRSAVRQLKGQLAVSHDNFESVAIGTAKRFLYTNDVQTLDSIYASLDAITPEYLYRLAQQFLDPNRMLTLVYSS